GGARGGGAMARWRRVGRPKVTCCSAALGGVLLSKASDRESVPDASRRNWIAPVAPPPLVVKFVRDTFAAWASGRAPGLNWKSRKPVVPANADVSIVTGKSTNPSAAGPAGVAGPRAPGRRPARRPTVNEERR